MSTELKHICVWGTSVRKVGDEAQLASVLSYLKQQNQDIDVTIISRQATRVKALLKQVDVTGDCIKLKDIISLYRHIKKADVMMIIGGPFFETWHQMLSISLIVFLTRLTSTKVVTFGTTLFPLHTLAGRLFYRYVYSNIPVISSRDHKAQEILMDIGVDKTIHPLVDPRYMLNPADKEHIRMILQAEGINTEKPYVAITTRHLHDDMPTWVKTQLGYTTESAQESYDTLASFFIKLTKNYQLVIIPMHPDLQEDYDTAEMLFSKCESNYFMLKKRYTPFEVIGIVQGSEFSIQSRLGSTVFSVLAGSPFLAISYEPRMSNWMNAHGLEEYCVDWCNINADKLQDTIHSLSVCTDNLRENFETLKIDQKNLFISQAENIFSELALEKSR